VALEPDLPDYAGACINNLVPALLEPHGDAPSWLPAEVRGAAQVVVLLLDGLGWEQLATRSAFAPTLAGMAGGPIHTVAPSTTAAALTSIATGMSPGEHGVIGYRMALGGDVLNVLRWGTSTGDARRSLPPEDAQPYPAFLGHRPPVVTRAEFADSGFTRAHLQGVRHHGYRVPSTLVVELRRVLAAGEPFAYAYYEGVDKVAHEYGLGEHYDAEVAAADQLVADVLEVLPPGAVLLVTADHGQVEVGDRIIVPHLDVAEHVSFQSGEGRFRWLHAKGGREKRLVEAATEHHGDVAWIVPREQLIAEHWFGPRVTPEALRRIGDVALVAREPVSFHDPHDSGIFELIGRHGSVTSAEMLVPLLAHANV
jgi:predicted AlkP superfamily pyrophosphatase or phosphodiesterase